MGATGSRHSSLYRSTRKRAICSASFLTSRSHTSSAPNITATGEVQSVERPGGTWRLEVQPRGGGGGVGRVAMVRRLKGFVGHLIHGLFQVPHGRGLADRPRRLLPKPRG